MAVDRSAFFRIFGELRSSSIALSPGVLFLLDPFPAPLTRYGSPNVILFSVDFFYMHRVWHRRVAYFARRLSYLIILV